MKEIKVRRELSLDVSFFGLLLGGMAVGAGMTIGAGIAVSLVQLIGRMIGGGT